MALAGQICRVVNAAANYENLTLPEVCRQRSCYSDIPLSSSAPDTSQQKGRNPQFLTAPLVVVG